MALENIFRITADLKHAVKTPKPVVTQADDVRFEVDITDGGKKWSPQEYTNLSRASLAVTRRDGTVIVMDGEIGRKSISFSLGKNAIEIPGEVEAAIQLYSGGSTSSSRITTIKFTFTVAEDPTGEGYVPSSDEMTFIETVMTDAQAKIDELSQVDVVQLTGEVSTARGGEASLGARLDKVNQNLAQKVTYVNDVKSMKLTTMSVGSTIVTLGFHHIFDGGGANYITTVQPNYDSNYEGILYHKLSNGYYANLNAEEVDVKQVGVKDFPIFDVLNLTEDEKQQTIENNERLQKLLSSGLDVLVSRGNYYLSDELFSYVDDQSIVGEGKGSVLNFVYLNELEPNKGGLTIANSKGWAVKNLSIIGDRLEHKASEIGGINVFGYVEGSSFETGIGLEIKNRQGTFSNTDTFRMDGVISDIWCTGSKHGCPQVVRATDITISNIHIMNGEHGISLYHNCERININNITTQTGSFRRWVTGYMQRGLVIQHGGKHINASNLNFSGANGCGIYIRQEVSSIGDISDVNISNLTFNGRRYNPDGTIGESYRAIWFEHQNDTYTIKNVHLINVTIKKVTNGISFDSDNNDWAPLKNIKLVNITIEDAKNMSVGDSGRPRIEGLTLNNITSSFEELSGDGGVRIANGSEVSVQNVITPNGSTFSVVGEITRIKTLSKITGTTPSTGTSVAVPYPEGMGQWNSYLLSFRIQRNNGVWLDVTTIDYGSSNATVTFPSGYNNLNYECVLIRI